ncbi:MAG: PAS domain S-box protein [Spirulinaceae cyanobacterium]
MIVARHLEPKTSKNLKFNGQQQKWKAIDFKGFWGVFGGFPFAAILENGWQFEVKSNLAISSGLAHSLSIIDVILLVWVGGLGWIGFWLKKDKKYRYSGLKAVQNPSNFPQPKPWISSVDAKLGNSEKERQTGFKKFVFPAYIWQKQKDDFLLVEVNEAAIAIASRPIESFLQQSVTQLGLPIQSQLENCYRDRNSFQGQIQVLTQDLFGISTIEAPRSLLLTYTSIDKNRVLCYFEDITERKRAEFELKQKLHNASALAHLAQLGVAETNLNKLMTQATAVVAEILALEFAKVLELLPNESLFTFRAGTGWPDKMLDATVSAVHNAHAGYTLQHQKAVVVEDFQTETRLRGTPLLFNHRILSGISVPIPGPEKPFGVLCVYSCQVRQYRPDEVAFLESVAQILAAAVQRHKLEAELNLMKRAIDASRNGIVISDAVAGSNPAIYVNQSFEKMTGYSAEEILGRNCRFLQGTENEQPGLKVLREALLEGRPCHTIVRNYRKDKSVFWNELYVAPVYNDRGHLTHYIGIQSDITERKQAEAERDRFFTLSLDMIGIATFEGEWVRCNPAWQKVLGYGEKEMVQQQFLPFVHQDDRDRTLEIFDKLKQGESIVNFENRYRTQTGEYRWLAWTAVPCIEDNLIYAVARDVTTQKQTEDRLRQQALMFELIYDGIATIALDGKILDWNPGAERIFALDKTAALGQSIEILSHSPEELDFEGKILPALKTHGRWFGELNFERHGVTKVCETTMVPLCNEQGEMIAVVSVSHDISQRKEAEIALRNERDLLNAIMQTSVAAISVVDAAGNIIFANDRAEEILGVSKADIQQLSCNNPAWNIADFEGLPLPNQQLPFEPVMKTGKPIFNVQQTLISPQGDRKHLSINGSPLKDNEGKIVGVVFSVNDISDRYLAEAALRESEERLSTIVAATSDALIVIDQKGKVRFANPAAEMLFGRDSKDLIEARASQLYSTRDAAEIMIHRPDGKTPVAEMRVVKMTWDNQQAYLASLRDVSERHTAEAALKKSEEQFRLLFELAPTGMALVSLDYRFQRVNQALCDTLALSAKDLIERSISDFSHTQDWDLHTEECDRLLQGLTSYFQMEKRYIAQNGKSISTLLQVALARDAQGQPINFIYQIVDITERKRAEAQLEYNAYYDTLTDLPNRTLFMERLAHTMRRSQRRGGYLFAVLFLDLDHFKVVNDSLGHIVGDRLLIAIARRLEACLRPSDTLARLGGDEFTVLLDGIEDVQVATNIAKELQQQIKQPFNLEGHEVFTNTSIGIAFNSLEYKQPEELLRDADTAMYRAKELGKARYAVFTSNMHATALARLQLETDLRRALSRQEIFAYYQPIVNLQTQELIGFEALARWQHPHRGLVSPGEFIPIAEETGLIVPLGRWMLQTACTQLQQWQHKFVGNQPLKMSVNLSGRQLKEANLIAEIASILQNANLPSNSLKLEITETLLMDNAKAAAEMFVQLQEMGIDLSIDDFGTGYSSLSYLHRFPFNTLKIDRSFVKNLHTDRSNWEIVQAIVTLAHTLGMDAIAEGIETREQLDQLQALGCEYGQGYYFAPPLTVEAAEKLIIAKVA